MKNFPSATFWMVSRGYPAVALIEKISFDCGIAARVENLAAPDCYNL